MHVKDIMNTKLSYLKEDQILSVSNIVSLEPARNIPVVDNELKLVGLITYRELIEALAKNVDSLLVRDFMITEVKTVSPDTPIKGAVELMVINKYGCLPVIDQNRKLFGMLTDIDLLKNLFSIEVKRVMKTEFNYFNQSQEITALDILNLDKIRDIPVVDDDSKLVGLINYKGLISALAKRQSSYMVKDIMTTETSSISQNTQLSEAIKLMVTHKYGCLPVTDSTGRLVGVVTEAELLRNLSGMTPLPADFYAVR